ncbi:Isoprenylcysteine carboxyl methyltransferase [Pedosphaera parvula Ellin514]|uniref:Isoprenylcysteine carboxyl methyltransferase n=2 Tax=Pedosphaera TaxID=1032526 RepID=B9XKW9_PEDPL|nr:Isoprenylcysteine carboxyl methyltransferase [Pedosphaera parvula Ellin514]
MTVWIMKPEIFIPIASVFLIYTARIIELRTKRDTIRGPVKENLTFRLFVLAGTVMVAGGLVEFLIRHSQLFWPTFVAGWLCAFFSFALRRRAIAALGKFWSLHVEIRDNHQFVRSGPFRFVRHPTYFSMILELLSGGFIFNAYWTMMAVTLLFIPALLMRLKLEESALIEKFGPTYKDYQQETPAIFPYKWPSTK